HAYPHQSSGGIRQRVMIAMALACKPKLVIADEPTTALDVTIQAQILDLLQDMKERFGMAVMLITHAMGVVAETAQRVVVMYAGKVVEEAPVDDLFGNPGHPYTQGLIRSIPRIDLDSEHKTRLEAIGGSVPILINPPVGEVVFDGRDVRQLGGTDLRAMRRNMQLVFQDPFASLNPRMTVGAILGEALIIHKLGSSAKEREDRVASLLVKVGLKA